MKMKQHFHEQLLCDIRGREGMDFVERVVVAEFELTHLQKPGSDTALSMVNQEEGQKSSLVGANAPPPDTCGTVMMRGARRTWMTARDTNEWPTQMTHIYLQTPRTPAAELEDSEKMKV